VRWRVVSLRRGSIFEEPQLLEDAEGRSWSARMTVTPDSGSAWRDAGRKPEFRGVISRNGSVRGRPCCSTSKSRWASNMKMLKITLAIHANPTRKEEPRLDDSAAQESATASSSSFTT